MFKEKSLFLSGQSKTYTQVRGICMRVTTLPNFDTGVNSLQEQLNTIDLECTDLDLCQHLSAQEFHPL